MTKNRSKMLIIFLSLLLIIGLVASFISFVYPFSINGVEYKYTSFVHELVLGSDIGDGVLLEYHANLREDYSQNDDFDSLMEDTIVGLKDILEDSGFKNSTIVRNGESGIRIEVGGIVDKDDSNEVISLIGSPEQLVFSSSESAEDAFMTGEYVSKVEAKQMSNGVQTVYYVEITFTDAGFEIIKDKSAEIIDEGGSFYMLLGSTQVGSSSEAVTTKSISMSSDNFVDLKTTEQYAIQIRTGMLPLDLVCSYYGTISAGLGYNSMLYIWIVLAIMIVASFAFFIIRYKQIGAMAMFNMMFYLVLALFFLQAVPLVHINFSGVLAIILSYVIACVGLMLTLENAKQEYKKGKKLHICLHQGINNSLISNITINVMLILAGIVSALMPNMAIQSFGIVSLVLGFINIFTSQVLMRLMINLYLPFNPEDGKKCNFIREGSND